MAGAIQSALAARLAALHEAGLQRELALPESGQVDFTSNDYLGLSRDAEVIEAARDAAALHGAGARASRLLGGGAPCDREAESALAQWVGQEDALLFPSGFQANLGAVATLAGEGDTVFSDALNHASIIDATRLSRARVQVFRHNGVSHLDELLGASGGGGRRLVVTEGVFSMDGDLAPLAELSQVCHRRDAWLVVDEAHSIGIVGPSGAGAWAAALQEGADSRALAALVVPCGKALGVAGGFVAGPGALRELLVSTARSFIFSTGAAPAVSGALVAAVRRARSADAERARLRELGQVISEALGVSAPPAAILPLVIGENEAALEATSRARAAGFDVRAVRPPTVPEGTARIRVVLHAANTEGEVRELALHIPRPAAAHESPKAQATPWFVTGTDTEIGKTVVSALLVRAAARVGAVTYWKPVQTGDDSDTETVRALAMGTEARFAEPRYHFPLPASPHEAAAAADSEVEVGALLSALADLRSSERGVLLAELAGGLLVPYDDATTQLDVLARLRPRHVLVARSGLGTLNHTLLSLEALRARGLEPAALFLVGEPHPSNRETLARMGRVARVYEVPRLDPLDATALDAWIDERDVTELFKT